MRSSGLLFCKRLSASFLLLIGAASAFEAHLCAAEPDAAALEFFEKKIRPIFVTHCSECHGKKKHGGLLLDSREGWMTGGDSGAAIVPGDLEKSILIKAVRWTDKDLRMPPKELPTLVQGHGM